MVMLIYTYELFLHINLYARYVIIIVAMVKCLNLLYIIILELIIIYLL